MANTLTKYLGLVVLSASLFFSCEDPSDVFNDINRFKSEPVGTAQNIRMVYTDSLKIQAVLTAPVHVDYTNLSFQYAEFPEGLKVVFYDENNNENTLTANYGILYTATKIIDLQGNVVLESHSGSALNTDQMYWDATAEWLFTEKPFTFKDADYDIAALRLDTNKEFTNFQTGNLTGTIAVTEQASTTVE